MLNKRTKFSSKQQQVKNNVEIQESHIAHTCHTTINSHSGGSHSRHIGLGNDIREQRRTAGKCNAIRRKRKVLRNPHRCG